MSEGLIQAGREGAATQAGRAASVLEAEGGPRG